MFAAAWLRGAYSYEDGFEALVGDPEIESLRERVEFRLDTDVADMRSANVELHFADGTTDRVDVEGFVGSALRPFSDDDLSARFASMATGLVSERRIDAIIEAVWNLDELASVTPLVDALYGRSSEL